MLSINCLQLSLLTLLYVCVCVQLHINTYVVYTHVYLQYSRCVKISCPIFVRDASAHTQAAQATLKLARCAHKMQDVSLSL